MANSQGPELTHDTVGFTGYLVEIWCLEFGASERSDVASPTLPGRHERRQYLVDEFWV